MVSNINGGNGNADSDIDDNFILFRRPTIKDKDDSISRTVSRIRFNNKIRLSQHYKYEFLSVYGSPHLKMSALKHDIEPNVRAPRSMTINRNRMPLISVTLGHNVIGNDHGNYRYYNIYIYVCVCVFVCVHFFFYYSLLM